MSAIVLAGILAAGALSALAAQRWRERRLAARARARVEHARRSPLPALLLLLALAPLGACVPAQAVRLLEVEQAASAGHAADASLPRQAREIALDHHDVCAVLLEVLDDRPLPPGTAARIKARMADAAPVGSR